MANTQAIRINQFGGPEQLAMTEVPLPPPGPREVQVRHTAIGINYIDTYHRSGLYPLPLPSGVGMEAAAVVEAVGSEVEGLTEGDRVAYGCGAPGAYSLRRNLVAELLIKVPASISDETAAAMMLKGMTAEYLLHRTYPVQAGEWVLFHAAAGGLGTFAIQWLRHLGARVIGTAGSAAKCARALELGCEHVLNYRENDWVKQLRDLTAGQGVSVVYDGVGRATFWNSLDCLRTRGMMVSLGNASGPAPAVEPTALSQRGSLFLTRPSLAAYVSTREDLLLSANRVLEVVQSGAVNVQIGARYPLEDAVQAHKDLEARSTTGALLLLPKG